VQGVPGGHHVRSLCTCVRVPHHPPARRLGLHPSPASYLLQQMRRILRPAVGVRLYSHRNPWQHHAVRVLTIRQSFGTGSSWEVACLCLRPDLAKCCTRTALHTLRFKETRSVGPQDEFGCHFDSEGSIRPNSAITMCEVKVRL
jgi:hypothetical protein